MKEVITTPSLTNTHCWYTVDIADVNLAKDTVYVGLTSPTGIKDSNKRRQINGKQTAIGAGRDKRKSRDGQRPDRLNEEKG